MRMHEISFDGPVPVDGYGPGFFRVRDEIHRGPLLLLPGRIAVWAGLDEAAPILALKAEIDVLLVGTGPTIAPLPPAFMAALDDAAIGVEPMATPSACRTYNILLAEGRRIAAALLPV